MLKFKPFGSVSTASNHIYTTDGYVEFKVEKIVALSNGLAVDAIENPKMELLYFLVNVAFTGRHAHFLLVDRYCANWHECQH